MTDKKPFWQSWTLAFNLLTVLGIALTAIAEADVLTNPNVNAAIGVAIGFINVLLRFKTDRGVGLRDDDRPKSGRSYW